jgi:hypothetical protein
MIRLDAVTLIERGRAVLSRASFDFSAGLWHIAAEPHGDARLLIELLAGQQAPAEGAVRYGGARSWPLGQSALFGSYLSGLDTIDALCSLYALERRGTVRLFHDLFAAPEWLTVRFDRWPPALQRQFGQIALLAPAFDIYLLDVSPVLPDIDFYRRWRALFQERAFGKTVIVASGDHRAALRDFPGERVTLAGGTLHREAAAAAPAIAAE